MAWGLCRPMSQSRLTHSGHWDLGEHVQLKPLERWLHRPGNLFSSSLPPWRANIPTTNPLHFSKTLCFVSHGMSRGLRASLGSVPSARSLQACPVKDPKASGMLSASPSLHPESPFWALDLWPHLSSQIRSLIVSRCLKATGFYGF